ncbi:60S ribosomal protein L27a, partial [Plecturocebus cupreus]
MFTQKSFRQLEDHSHCGEKGITKQVGKTNSVVDISRSVQAADMPSRLRKTQKHRGHMSRGHSCRVKHQKPPGGLGNAGGMHHHRINFGKIAPRSPDNRVDHTEADRNGIQQAMKADVS